MKLKNKFYFLPLLMVASMPFLSSCGGTKIKIVHNPAGVDSTTALAADSLAQHLFVEWKYQKLARRKVDTAKVSIEQSNRLWNALAGNHSAVVSTEDTLEAVKRFNHGAASLQELTQLTRDGNIDSAEVRERAYRLLQTARINFEGAIILNPFDRQARYWLSQVYQLLAQRYAEQKSWKKAADVLEKLVQMDGSQHKLFASLGNCYANLDEWSKALEAFQIAESVLRESEMVDISGDLAANDAAISTEIDSSKLFLYVYYQALANMRLFNETAALAELERARTLARNDADRELVQESKLWAIWDNGNLPASEMRDTLLALIDRGEYKKAARGFDELLPNLRTQRTRQEIKWRLAQLEFIYLKHQEAAIERMKQVIDFISADSTEIALTDTLRQQYIDTYGTMCYNLGLKALEEHKQLRALTYFMQSVTVPWSFQAKAYLEISKLSYNNPANAVEMGKMALARREQLSPVEIRETLAIIIEGLRRQRRFTEAKVYYDEFRTINSPL